MLSGCFHIVPPGSTKADALQAMGRPTAVRPAQAGEEIWEYSGAPSWRQAYLVRFGADARVKESAQVLSEGNFGKLVGEGATREHVRNTLGKPGYVVTYPTGEVWEYRIWDDHRRPAKMAIQFGSDGKVKEVSKILEEFLRSGFGSW
jgi:hypothetical protein